MSLISKLFFHSPKRYIAAVIITAVITVVRILLLSPSWFALVDGLGMGGVLTALFGLLVLVANLGAFNLFAYSFSTHGLKRKYRTYYDYTEAKNEERRGNARFCVPYVTVGILAVIASMVMDSLIH
jgi:uncharacterized membrane protein (DUF373 family)